MKRALKVGDYVLATKWHDGDPCDHFCVGYFVGMLCGDRYLVADKDGKLFRANGFRRCERVSPAVGNALVALMPTFADKAGRRVWWWRRNCLKAKENGNG